MNEFIQTISKSLSRTSVPRDVPKPPVIDDAITRLVRADADLKQHFIEMARGCKMIVEEVLTDDLAAAIQRHLSRGNAASCVVTRCELFDRVGLLDHLSGVSVRTTVWDQSTLDDSYDVDAGVTDVWRAVAETGSLVMRASKEQGRAVSLVPVLHIAVVRTSQIVPDLIDLMRETSTHGTASGIVIISGPSKTADIEMNLVVGVHGPGEVVVLVVDDSMVAM